jgi:phospholipase C
MSVRARALCLPLPLAGSLACLMTACAADGGVADQEALFDLAKTDRSGIRKVKHVILVMQENHSFDNYFGALAYAPSSRITGLPGRATAVAPPTITAASTG